MTDVKQTDRKRLVTEQPSALIKRIKMRAVEEDKSVTDVVHDALTKYVEQPQQLSA